MVGFAVQFHHFAAAFHWGVAFFILLQKNGEPVHAALLS